MTRSIVVESFRLAYRSRRSSVGGELVRYADTLYAADCSGNKNFKAFISRLRVVIFSLAIFLCSSFAYGDCIDDVAVHFGLDPRILRAIGQFESHMMPLALNRNADGSFDIGLMQINSRWFNTLAHAGIRPETLWDRCVNAYVGAWILRSNIARFGATWKAVGAYNASSPTKQLIYANHIYAQWLAMKKDTPVDPRP